MDISDVHPFKKGKNMPKSLVRAASLIALLLIFPIATFAKPSQPPSPPVTADATGFLFHGVTLRPGVTADIHVKTLSGVDGKDCLFILHGGPFTAESWRPFAETLRGDPCILGLDMPARDRSTVPAGMVFGDLLMDDYVNIVLEVLDRLDRQLHIKPRTIAGHSLGGMVLQMVQQRLVDEGTDLRHRFNVRDAILVASDFPQDVPWAFGDNGGAAAIAPFIVQDPVLGSILRIEAEVWPAFFFTNKDGQLIAGAPTPAEIAAGGWVAPGEPEQALNQLLGAGAFDSRPHIQAGIFSKGTRLRVVAYEGDGFILLSESPGLYSYLTGDESQACFVGVLGADKVHATHISDPGALVTALAASEGCRYGRP